MAEDNLRIDHPFDARDILGRLQPGVSVPAEETCVVKPIMLEMKHPDWRETDGERVFSLGDMYLEGFPWCSSP